MTSEKHHCALSKSISFQEMRDMRNYFYMFWKILISIFFVTYHLYRGSMTIVPWSITPGQLPPPPLHEIPPKKISPRTFTHQTIIITIIIIIIHLFQFGFTNYNT